MGTTIPRRPGLTNLTFENELPYTLIAFGFLLLIVFVIWSINQTRISFFLRSIKDDEDAALCMGVNVFRVKMLIFALSAFFTA